MNLIECISDLSDEYSPEERWFIASVFSNKKFILNKEIGLINCSLNELKEFTKIKQSKLQHILKCFEQKKIMVQKNKNNKNFYIFNVSKFMKNLCDNAHKIVEIQQTCEQYPTNFCTNQNKYIFSNLTFSNNFVEKINIKYDFNKNTINERARVYNIYIYYNNINNNINKKNILINAHARAFIIENESCEKVKKTDKPKYFYECKNVLGFLNSHTNNFFKFNRENFLIIRDCFLKGYSEEDLKKVIRFKTEKWKDNEVMRGYLRPSTLFKISNFENYLAECKAVNNLKPMKTLPPLFLESNGTWKVNDNLNAPIRYNVEDILYKIYTVHKKHGQDLSNSEIISLYGSKLIPIIE